MSGAGLVAIDLLFRCLLAMGAKPKDLRRSIAAYPAGLTTAR